MATAIRLEGMAEFRKDLRSLDKRFLKGIQKANKRAAEMVAEHARALLIAHGGVREKSAPSIKARAGQAYAAVKINAAAHPYALGANFGSIQFKQFPAFRQNGEGDYGLYKAIHEKRKEVIEGYDEFVAEGFKDAFPD